MSERDKTKLERDQDARRVPTKIVALEGGSSRELEVSRKAGASKTGAESQGRVPVEMQLVAKFCEGAVHRWRFL